MMFCTECGDRVDNDHRFCSNCGTYIARNVSELEASLPALEPRYRVSYTYGSWLSKLTGRVVYSLIWFGIGMGLTIFGFNLLRQFEFIAPENIRLTVGAVMGVYWAYIKGWNANRFSTVLIEDEETDTDSQLEDDDDITASLDI